MSIDLVSLYADLHAHPELGFSEVRTAGLAAAHMRSLGLTVTEGVGGTGVVAVLENGPGPVVCLRADMDALPMLEKTGLAYASTARGTDADGRDVPVMHACGHDVHVTCLVGAVERLVAERADWSGTLLALFQPAEELVAGAAAMVADGLLTRFPRPDIILGQHVTALPAGTLALRGGAVMAGGDSFTVTFHGRGGHAARPHTTLDPVVAASAAVLRLQTIVSREVDPADPVVVTVGAFHAGTKNNIIPDEATLGVSIRTVGPDSRDRVLEAFQRVVEAEAAASGMSAPTVESTSRTPATVNDHAACARLRSRFEDVFGEAAVIDPGVGTASEDIGVLAGAAEVPLVYWFFGSADPEVHAAAEAADTLDRDVPSNHSPFFAPVIPPTLAFGVEALTVAAREWYRAP